MFLRVLVLVEGAIFLAGLGMALWDIVYDWKPVKV
jgi:hypothetical protein